MMSDLVVAWFSCGVPSAVAAKLAIERHKNVMVVNTPVAEEHIDNNRFLADCEKWFGQKVILATNPKYKFSSCDEVWRKRRFMSGIHGAPCTKELKKEARYEFEKQHDIAYHLLGFTADEKNRADRFKLTERANTITPLIDDNLTREDCAAIISDAGITIPEMYKLGYPNNNCIGCVKATSPTYWNKVRETHPEVFKERSELSKELGVRLVRVRGERIFLDELKETDRGKPLKSLKFDCGLFCEEYQEEPQKERG